MLYIFQDETTSTVAPARLYKALTIDGDTIIPKVIPGFRTVEIVEGNGGPGTIKKLTFEEDGQTKELLHKIDSIDQANLKYNYSIVGGTDLPATVEKISFEAHLVVGSNGGSIAKHNINYHTKGNASFSEEEVMAGKAKGDALFKAIEGYVLANPDYN